MRRRILDERISRPATDTENAIPRPAPIDGDGLQLRVERLLGAEPLAVDELVRQCHASPAAIQDILLQLEMDGRICRHPGNRVALELA